MFQSIAQVDASYVDCAIPCWTLYRTEKSSGVDETTLRAHVRTSQVWMAPKKYFGSP